jgi:phosphoribosylanthranilate isomerase
MLIKVCGLRDLQNIEQVRSIGGVDLIGLIFYPKSPRYVDPSAAAVLRNPLVNVSTVGVFVDAVIDEVLEICDSFQLKYIQLHGSESIEYLLSLRKLLPPQVGIIKAFSVANSDDLMVNEEYEKICNYFLFDTATVIYGGSGSSFDWSLLNQYSGKTKFILSGGIRPDSLEALHQISHPLWAGIDLNSRFETAPAQKDISLLNAFIHSFNHRTS